MCALPTKADFKGFWAWSVDRADEIAVQEVSGRTASFADLAAASNQIANGLYAEGFEPGDCVAMLAPNCIEFLEAYFGTYQSGVYFTAINHYLAPPEIAYVLKNSDARLLIIHERYRDLALGAIEQSGFPEDRCLWLGEGTPEESYEAFKAQYSKARPDKLVAGQTMMYSSGTTGQPKGIRPPLPKEPPDDYNASKSWVAATFGFREGDGVHLVNGPLHHAGPHIYCTVSLHHGHKVVLIDKWEARLALEMIERHKVTSTMMVPTMFNRLLKIPEDERRAFDISSLEVLIHAAAPCAVSVKHDMINWVGPILFDSYGGTEGPGTTCNSEQWLSKPGTSGPPSPGITVKIYDDDGNELPAGEIGSVYLSPAYGLPQYFKDPVKTEEARKGKFYTLGDMGYLDEDGWLFLVDRKSDMLISGGVNIYPAEIEQALIRHPKIVDIAVIGVPNEEWGEEVKAIIELDEDVEPSEALAEDIVEYGRKILAKYKLPRSVDFVDSLPRADNGKLYKRQLKDKYWAGHDTRI